MGSRRVANIQPRYEWQRGRVHLAASTPNCPGRPDRGGMLGDVVSRIQRWQYRGGRPRWSARITNRLGAVMFGSGIGPSQAAAVEMRGHKSGRTISFPVVVTDYQGERYLVAMLGQKTNWVRNLRAGDSRAMFQPGSAKTSLWSRTSPTSARRSCVGTSSWRQGHVRSSRSTAARRSVTSSASSISIRFFASTDSLQQESPASGTMRVWPRPR
ncbi:MAG: hypothetical protein QOC90_2393 [Mycobacterium sp.]|nr:hypothetical protein [Mycobacterium sp.]